MAFSQFDLDQMQARLSRNKLRDSLADHTGAERETGNGGLHAQVEAECNRRLWGYATNRTDKRSTSGLGVCDFIIAADRGRTFWIELKSKTGKQSIAQMSFEAVLRRNGHTYHLITSFDQFLDVVK